MPDVILPREAAHADRFPFMLLTPPARHALNSSFDAVDSLRRETGAPQVEIHPDDAAARGIADGDRVRVFNDRGGFARLARVTDRVRPGVLVALSIGWLKHAADGENVNAVTPDGLTDIGRGATYYDCAVDIARMPVVAAALS